MIPKIIHYCWFGGKPLPELAKKCIASWKKYCPDYEIKEWNEANYDFSGCEYAQEAYKAKNMLLLVIMLVLIFCISMEVFILILMWSL